jgi:hypothetical protein
MNILKLNYRLWKFISFDENGKFRNTTQVRQYVEKFNGRLYQSIGYGMITFESEKDLTWFVLRVE